MQLYRDIFKRCLDLVMSVVAVILLSPVFVAVVIFLFIANQGKPFFFQRRPGKSGRIFMLVKFKTMNDRKDAAGNLLPDEKRLTSVGKFIRKTSLDEIPQLLNVVKGDMSLVGPRPLLVEYLSLYSPFQNRRHEVKPGITGWAQVNGYRGETETLEKMKGRIDCDLEYLRNWSLRLDLYIIAKTMWVIFGSNNAH